MGNTRHSLGQYEGTSPLFIGIKATATGVGGISITISSTTGVTGPLAMASDVTITRTGVGAHTLTVNPFKGPLGGVIHAITAQTNGTAVGVSTTTAYTNDSLALTIALFTTSQGITIDADFNAILHAF